ncbi:hypothetical protein C8T65DRAFT_701948 [Cerioporus squamosus]|nr:hypothetical protein C8T65DRAFT_701948 [Cerioporus squamosus]
MAVHAYYSRSTIIVVSMEIEDQQMHSSAALMGSARSKTLHHYSHCSFMPSIITLITQPASGDESPLPQKLLLFLPSAACIEVIVPPILLDHEWRLRQAQAYDTLTDLRGHLKVRAYVYRYKDQNLHGQQEILRSCDVVNSIKGKIKVDAAHYCAAYTALTTLSGALSKLDFRVLLLPIGDCVA